MWTRSTPSTAEQFRGTTFIALILAGCSAEPTENTPPGDDPARISAAVSNIELAIGTKAMHSLFVVGDRMIIPGTVTINALAAGARCGPGRTVTRTQHPAPGTRHLFTGLIADSLFGRAFTYDAPSRSYLPTATTTGPANGVRFVLDDVDNYGGYILPRNQVGWLDLTDAGSGGLNRLRASVVGGSVLNADYLVTPSGYSGAYAALLAGRVSDGRSSFVFTDSIQVTGPEINLFAVVDSAESGVRITVRVKKVNLDPADFLYDLDLTASRGEAHYRLLGRNTAYCYFSTWHVSVTRNDSALASLFREGAGTSLTPEAGRTLGATESRVILDLMDIQQLLFDWLNALFMPVWRLLPP